MNREIKFRAFDKTNGKIFPLHDLRMKAKEAVIDTIRDDGAPSFKYIDFKEVEIMQFIGLLDKNGNEIYEDDIVKDRFGRIMKVGYWNYRLCFIAISETNFHHADFYDCFMRSERTYDENFKPVKTEVEIIGNIYENKDLLLKYVQ